MKDVAPSQPLEANSKTRFPHLRVLIVEDNLINQKVLSKQLRHAGCTTHLANHGLEALDILARSTFAESPTSETLVDISVCLMDLEMPIMDGLTCVKRIRALEAEGSLAQHVPVIAVTANARSEQISAAMDAGMDLVITKPFRIPELLPQMDSLLKRMAEELREEEEEKGEDEEDQKGKELNGEEQKGEERGE